MRRANELNPNDSMTLICLGFCEATSGNPQRGIEHGNNALRLSPRDPLRYNMLNILGWGHFAAGEYVKAAEFAQRSVGEAPNLPAPRLCLVIAWITLGEIDRARSEFQAVRKLAPELVDARVAGQFTFSNPVLLRRATTFLRIAAGLEDPGAAAALR